MFHLPRFWKHKETKEVIDHETYSDLKEPHSSNFEECDVTGELKKEAPENTGEPTVTVEEVLEPVEVTPVAVDEGGEQA